MFDKLREALKGKAAVAPAKDVQPQPAKERSQIEAPVVLPFTDSTIDMGGERIRQPDILKGDVDHAGHLRILARNDEEAGKLCIDALAASRDRKTVHYGTDDIAGYLSGKSELEILTLTKNGETFAAYPLFPVGRPAPARITQIIECNNTYEGQLEVYLNDGTVTFFDSLYFRNRSSYYPGKDVRVLISGIAYVLSKVRTQSHATKAAAEEVLVRYENGDVDDYVFRGVVEGVKDTTVFGKKAVIIKTTARTGPDSAPFELYLCATSSAISEKISPGDYISGIIWLQGFVV